MQNHINKTEEEWRAILTPEQFRILRKKGTEPPGTGEYNKHKESGVYNCAACSTPLYKSTTKFDSGCGWPAFFDAIPGAVSRHEDLSHGMARIEITCTACGGHLGHVFKGERFNTPTDERHCIAKTSTVNKSKTIPVTFTNGTSSQFHGIWLRDHCRCSKCFHPITKQRLLDTSSIPLDIAPVSFVKNIESDTLEVSWSDGHRSTYPLPWLLKNSYYPKLYHQDTREIKLWGSKLSESLPSTHFDEIMQSDNGLAKWLKNIHEFGIGFVNGVPISEKKTHELAKRISHIRETHYGTFWNFTADLAHGDTAYTNIALPAHTDTTYFTDPVGLQLFHLLKHTGTGGESLLVDGFNVALQLQQKHQWAFDLLTTLKISSHCAGDKDIFIQPSPLTFPIIRLDPDTGHLLQIRFNNDDRSVLSFPGITSAGEQVELFYAALQEWSKLLKSKENELWVKLEPGQVVIMDNWRVLHGRASFTGFRRMVGCYIGYDDFQSRLKTVLLKQKEKLI